MSDIGVDPDVWTLAGKFLADDRKTFTAAEQQKLAEDIQRAIENWFLADESGMHE